MLNQYDILPPLGARGGNWVRAGRVLKPQSLAAGWDAVTSGEDKGGSGAWLRSLGTFQSRKRGR